MTLAAGDRLAHYEIAAPIGKGGMGEVWRAKDTKLGRDVARRRDAHQRRDQLAEDRERRIAVSSAAHAVSPIG